MTVPGIRVTKIVDSSPYFEAGIGRRCSRPVMADLEVLAVRKAVTVDERLPKVGIWQTTISDRTSMSSGNSNMSTIRLRVPHVNDELGDTRKCVLCEVGDGSQTTVAVCKAEGDFQIGTPPNNSLDHMRKQYGRWRFTIIHGWIDCEI